MRGMLSVVAQLQVEAGQQRRSQGSTSSFRPGLPSVLNSCTRRLRLQAPLGQCQTRASWPHKSRNVSIVTEVILQGPMTGACGASNAAAGTGKPA